MSEGHSGLSHDLPEYVPNSPPPKVKARVYKARDDLWYWGHACRGGGWGFGLPYASQAMALKGALAHMEGCW